MTYSESIKAIAVDLIKAQSAMGSAIKDSDNPFFKSKYADLAAVMEACKEALNTNGIVVLQPVMGNVLETYLIHTSGEWMKSETSIVCKDFSNPQAYGSAITYARRYGLQSMVFIPAEDDDANSATGNKVEKKEVKEEAKVDPTNKCPICHATGKFHAPTCPNKEL